MSDFQLAQPVIFYSMDKTEGKNDFVTHRIDRDAYVSKYTYSYKSHDVLRHERIVTISHNTMEIENRLFSPLGTLQENSRTKLDKITQDLSDKKMAANKCVIQNYGGMLAGLNDTEKQLVTLMNNGKQISAKDLQAVIPHSHLRIVKPAA